MEVYKYKYNIHFCIHFQFFSYTSPASLAETYIHVHTTGMNEPRHDVTPRAGGGRLRGWDRVQRTVSGRDIVRCEGR